MTSPATNTRPRDPRLDASDQATTILSLSHAPDELIGESFPYLPFRVAAAVHVTWCELCAALVDESEPDDERPTTVTPPEIEERIASAERAAKQEWLSYPEGRCRNGHDTAVGGRYRNTGKCVTCISEQGRRSWQKRKRQPPHETAYEFFMTPEERKRHKAFCAQTPDWRLPRDTSLLAEELRAAVPPYLSEADTMDVIAELIVVVVKQGYIVNEKLLRDHAKKYARTLPNRYEISTDDILPGTDGLRLADTLAGDVWA